MSEFAIANAQIVLPDDVVHGSVLVRDGRIAEIDRSGRVPVGALDFGGDYLLPGLVELHTDNLEKHVRPRPGVRWPMLSAVLAHDGQIASSGITTVFDALAVGVSEKDKDFLRRDMLQEAAVTVERAQHAGLTRADHFLHMRCEVAHEGVPAMLEPFLASDRTRLVSLMDHTPGQRQFTDIEKFREYYRGAHGFTDEQLEKMVEAGRREAEQHALPNRRRIVADCSGRPIRLASHDDSTEAHVAESLDLGLTISEFPTTIIAARASRAGGMRTIMGAPNVVRGGSHSGNIAAAELARLGLLDCLSSDYVPASLLHAAFLLHDQIEVPLPEAVAIVSLNPASMAGLDDRGAIELGRRADMVRVALAGDFPVVRAVWREGSRVA